WHYKLLEIACVQYDPYWKKALEEAHLLPKEGLDKLNLTFGTFIGDQVNDFIRMNKLNGVELVCSHGHTVFHDPDAGYTLQIG
ncbi:MAG: anhydro-N-acetylmuramic acid kinase, partial [Flavobacteriales bacterium]|nr:anhydro-N-acetylmuramic acid kinase [Flavobacteriales bacterium]